MTSSTRSFSRTSLVIALFASALTACAVDADVDGEGDLAADPEALAARAPSEQTAAADVVAPLYEELIVWRCSTTGRWYAQQSHCASVCTGQCDMMLTCRDDGWPVPCN
jgi:hypothetical protein